MTKENKKAEAGVCSSCCGCACHAVGSYHWHVLLRWCLGVVIIVLVFNLGVSVGELKGSLLGNRWNKLDDTWPGPMMMRFDRAGVQMPFWSAEVTTSSSTNPVR